MFNSSKIGVLYEDQRRFKQVLKVKTFSTYVLLALLLSDCCEKTLNLCCHLSRHKHSRQGSATSIDEINGKEKNSTSPFRRITFRFSRLLIKAATPGKLIQLFLSKLW